MKLLELQNQLSGMLSPLGAMYGMAMSVRRNLWEHDLFQRFAPPCPCVSVGNICWGGTGKTPLVDWIMGRCVEQGLRAVVLTRGYKGNPTTLPLQVSDKHMPSETGDEPLMLALRHPEATVLVDPNRRRAAEEAMRSLNPGLFILDDGMQHLAVKRHLELVVLRPDDLDAQWNRVIPQGSWRENFLALTRAHAFFLKTDPDSFRALAPRLTERLATLKRPVFSFHLKPTGLLSFAARKDGPTLVKPAYLQKKPYVLLSGVGNPKQVLDTTCRFMGYPPDDHLVFPDHHEYTFNDVRDLEARGIPVLCTAKDAVKLRHTPMTHLWCIHVDVEFGPALWSPVPFPEWWDDWLMRITETLAGPRPGDLPEALFDAEAALDMATVSNAQVSAYDMATSPQTSPLTPPAAPPTAVHPPVQSMAPLSPEPSPQAAPIRFATPPRPGKGQPAPKSAGKPRAWADDSQRPPRPKTPGLPGGRNP